MSWPPKARANFSRFMRIPSLGILLALAFMLLGPPPARAQADPNPYDLQCFRRNHTATTLPNGQVLVTGGYGVPASDPDNTPPQVLNMAEIYDPSTGTWRLTRPLRVARQYHTATLLPNGQVLVAGGDNGRACLLSVELYDPISETWTLVGNLIIPRAEHTASPVYTGTTLKILMAGGRGGLSGSPALANYNAELFDPTPTVFQSHLAPNLPTPRINHAAVNGSTVVLIMGGYDNQGNLLSSYEYFDGDSGTWVVPGDSDPKLTRGHARHTATLLPGQNGRVLWAGGDDGVDDRGTETFFLTDYYMDTSLFHWGHRSHTATVLPSGQVLVVGGWDTAAGGASFFTEIYDPKTLTWKVGNPLDLNRAGHTASLLANGQILLVGGYSEYSPFMGADLYYPNQGFWYISDSFGNLKARELHTSTLLPTGKVLVTGGWNGTAYMSSAQLFTDDKDYGLDGTWSDTAPLNPARARHTATLLPCGLVLVAGGRNPAPINNVQLYDPHKGTWRPTQPMKQARYQHTATLLADGKILVTGGCDSANKPTASTELYDPATGRWIQVGSLNTGRMSHTATLLYNGQVLVTGGYDSNYNDVALAEIYDPTSRTWNQLAAPMITPRDGHTATLLTNGKVLVAGGWDNNLTKLKTAELFDPGAGTWTSTGNMNESRLQHTATLLSTGLVLAAGGKGASGYSDTSELYNLATGTWIYNDSMKMEKARFHHTATLMNSGSVLAAGGSNDTTVFSTYSIFTDLLGLDYQSRPQIVSVQTLPPPAESQLRGAMTGPGFCLGISMAQITSMFMESQQLTQGTQVQLLSVEAKQAIAPTINATQSTSTFLVTDVIHGATDDIYQVTVSIGGIPSLAIMVKIGKGEIPPGMEITPVMGLLMD